MIQQQDVLWFEIGVDEVQVVEEGDGPEQLAGKGLNVRAWEWHKGATLKEVKDRQPQERCDDANVTSPVEAVAQLDTSIAVVLVCLSKCLQDSKFNATSIAVLSSVSVLCSSTVGSQGNADLRHSSDDLDGHLLAVANINRSHDFAKRSLAEEVQKVVLLTQAAVLVDDVMTILVINLLGWFVPLQKEVSFDTI